MARDIPFRRGETARATGDEAGNKTPLAAATVAPQAPVVLDPDAPAAPGTERKAVTTPVAAPERAVRPARRPFAPGRITLEGALYLGVLLLALLTRFFDLGTQGQHHDESLHSYFSWLYYTGQGYGHDPLMHGPFLFHVATLAYFLFGDSDATSRFAAALFGALTVPLPFFLRRELGRWGALIAATMLLISPSFLYFGRFHRHDVYSAFFTFLLFIAIVRFIDRPRPLWAYVGAAAWGFLFTNKEDFFIVTAIFGSALAVAVLWRAARQVLWLGAGLLVALAFAAKVLPRLLGWPHLPEIPWESPTNEQIRNYVVALLSHPIVLTALLLVAGFGVLAWSTLSRAGGDEGVVDGVFGYDEPGTPVAGVHALLSDGRTLWGALALAAGIYTVLYTSFFTNMIGIGSGSFGAIGYWLGQQDVQRAEQPWFYYLLLLPQYDPLAAILGAAAIALTGWRLLRHRLGRGSEGPFPFVRGFICYWAVASVGIYSWAGEKMPWMDIHLVLPLTLLTAIMLGSALEGLMEGGGRRAEGRTAATEFTSSAEANRAAAVLPAAGPPSALVTGGLIVAVAAAWFIVAARLSAAAARGDTSRWGLLLLPPLAIAAIVAAYGAREGWGRAGRTALLAGAGALLLFHVHAGWSLAFERDGHTATDMLVYVQTSPDVTRVMDELDRFSYEMTGGKDLSIMYDADTSWPFQWYLRDYRNKQYIGNNLTEPPPDTVAVVMVGPETLQTNPGLTAQLGNYAPQQYAMRWHFPEDETYRQFALAPELRPERNSWSGLQPPYTVGDVARSIASSLRATAEPANQARLFRLLAYRDLSSWGPLGSYDFTIYVRKDLLPQYNDLRYR